jgi:hypothetical protein
MLANGIPTDLVDDHLAVGESQAIKCFKRFVVAIVRVLSEEYLRSSDAQDTARLVEYNKINDRRKKGVLLKLDISRAFDSLSWSLFSWNYSVAWDSVNSGALEFLH